MHEVILFSALIVTVQKHVLCGLLCEFEFFFELFKASIEVIMALALASIMLVVASSTSTAVAFRPDKW